MSLLKGMRLTVIIVLHRGLMKQMSVANSLILSWSF